MCDSDTCTHRANNSGSEPERHEDATWYRFPDRVPLVLQGFNEGMRKRVPVAYLRPQRSFQSILAVNNLKRQQIH